MNSFRAMLAAGRETFGVKMHVLLGRTHQKSEVISQSSFYKVGFYQNLTVTHLYQDQARISSAKSLGIGRRAYTEGGTLFLETRLDA